MEESDSETFDDEKIQNEDNNGVIKNSQNLKDKKN